MVIFSNKTKQKNASDLAKRRALVHIVWLSCAIKQRHQKNIKQVKAVLLYLPKLPTHKFVANSNKYCTSVQSKICPFCKKIELNVLF